MNHIRSWLFETKMYFSACCFARIPGLINYSRLVILRDVTHMYCKYYIYKQSIWFVCLESIDAWGCAAMIVLWSELTLLSLSNSEVWSTVWPHCGARLQISLHMHTRGVQALGVAQRWCLVLRDPSWSPVEHGGNTQVSAVRVLTISVLLCLSLSVTVIINLKNPQLYKPQSHSPILSTYLAIAPTVYH